MLLELGLPDGPLNADSGHLLWEDAGSSVRFS